MLIISSILFIFSRGRFGSFPEWIHGELGRRLLTIGIEDARFTSDRAPSLPVPYPAERWLTD
jgi:hypothetical protein